jgi:hypothetical protein
LLARGSVLIFLNNSPQYILLLLPAIVIMIFCWILNIFYCLAFPQETPYVMPQSVYKLTNVIYLFL